MTLADTNHAQRPGDKAIRREPDDAEARLARWFGAKLGHRVVASGFARPADGFSGDTFLFDLADADGGSRDLRRLVLRIDVRENVMIPLSDFSRLHRVQADLHEWGGVPVPAVLHVEPDPSVLGAPFYISAFVDGLAPGDSAPYTAVGWVPQATSAERREMVFSGIETLARLHALDWRTRGLGFLRRGVDAESELERDLDYYVGCCDWAYGGRWDFVDQIVAWLRAHWPRTERLAFSWGDARLGNMLWRDFRPVAVLDWDWAAIGDPGRDLGYWLFNHHYFCTVPGKSALAWPSREETVAHYERCAGRRIDDLPFWEAYGGLRQLALMIRVTRLMERAGTVPTPDFVVNNPVVTIVRGMIGGAPLHADSGRAAATRGRA